MVGVGLTWRLFAVVALCITLCSAQTWRASPGRSSGGSSSDCGPCARSECKPARDCPAGLAYDSCGCCSVCAKAENELCEHPALRDRRPTADYLGVCGDNLECRLRDDLAPSDAPEALCQCTKPGVLCGSDGQTYENMCRLLAASVEQKNKITISTRGPCRSAPVIIGTPENEKNVSGSNMAMVCEARGFPIPTIEWTWTQVDGKTLFLPNDDLQVSVNMRGGPEKWQVTGWLQIMDMGKHHEGDYTCIAQNELGENRASARLKVIEPEGNSKYKRQ